MVGGGCESSLREAGRWGLPPVAPPGGTGRLAIRVGPGLGGSASREAAGA